MNVLVTGSAGYLGPVIVRHLREAGHTVLGYDIGWFGREDGADWFVRGDIRDPLVHPAWPDAVVHLAGLSNDPMGDLDETLTEAINLVGTVKMVRHYPTARHVIISSCAAYGQTDVLATETTPTNPQTVYAEMKATVDYVVHEQTGRLPTEAISLRLGTVYGHAPNHRLDLVVNKMVHDAANGRAVTVYGNAARPLVHVEDVASAVRWAVEGTATGIYNVIGENVRMRDLARWVAAFAGSKVDALAGGSDTRDYMASGEKLLRAGWHPTRTVEGSLPVLFERTFALPPDGHYVRLTTLRRLIDDGVLDPSTLRLAA